MWKKIPLKFDVFFTFFGLLENFILKIVTDFIQSVTMDFLNKLECFGHNVAAFTQVLWHLLHT